MRKLLLSSVLILAGLAPIASHAQVDPNRTVATVNGEEIKGAEYYRRMEFLPGVQKRYGNDIAEFPPGFLTLEQLITERLILQLAKEKGVVPSEPEIEQEIRFRLEDNPRLLEDLPLSGKTEAEFRHEVKMDLASFKLQTFGVNVTDQDVQNIYKTRQQDYTIPKRYKLRVIVVGSDADAATVDTELKTKPFAEVAKARSLDLSKSTGGEFGTVPESSLQPNMKSALGAIRVGQTTAWIPAGERRVKFLLEDVIAQQVRPLDAKLTREIRRKELLLRGSVRNNLQNDMKAIRGKAKIDIREKPFAEAYKAFIEQYLKVGG